MQGCVGTVQTGDWEAVRDLTDCFRSALFPKAQRAETGRRWALGSPSRAGALTIVSISVIKGAMSPFEQFRNRTQIRSSNSVSFSGWLLKYVLNSACAHSEPVSTVQATGGGGGTERVPIAVTARRCISTRF